LSYKRFEPGAPYGDDGEFGSDEETVKEDKRDYEDESQSYG
jgi:hypothetical protein